MASRGKATASLLSTVSEFREGGSWPETKPSRQKRKKKIELNLIKCAPVQGKSRVCTYSMVVEGRRSLRDKIPEPGNWVQILAPPALTGCFTEWETLKYFTPLTF